MKNMKKRKLNSKNPKYKDHSSEKVKRILKKVPLTGKAPGYGIFYENEK